MSKLWRLQTNTDSISGAKIAEYCLDQKVAAMGWSIKDTHIPYSVNDKKLKEIIEKRKKINSYNDYIKLIDDYKIYQLKDINNVYRLCHNVKEDDMIWIRMDGIYYLGHVTEKSKWIYNNCQQALDLDAANQITDIDWYKIGDESDVPGAITTAMIRGKTLQNIWKEGALEFSQLLINEKKETCHYEVFSLQFNKNTFYNLLSPYDCEDLLCMWLFAEKGYVCIPSSNKKSTELYECVLVEPSTGKRIYPQVKSGDVNLNVSDYSHLDGDVWLFTTKGHIINKNEGFPNIYIADPQKLFQFAGSTKARNILPRSISKWYEKLSDMGLSL